MTVVAGDVTEGLGRDEMLHNVTAALIEAAPIAEQADVMLILEPMNIRVDHKGHCLYGSAPAIRICEAVGSSHVKINWDLYHMHITEADLCGHLREGIDSGQIGYLQLAADRLGPLAERRIAQRGENWQALAEPFEVLDRPHLRAQQVQPGEMVS